MKRYVYSKLEQWKNAPVGQRKPLILEGARQVGKTWLAREFGKNEFKSFAEVNFEISEQLVHLFEANFDIDRILLALQAATGVRIVPGETLLFFDEIQHARRGLLSLKYFFEKIPELHVIAAGSLLGVIDHEHDSFPVGKVQFLEMHPLCFEEFLLAIGKQELVKMLHSLDFSTIALFSSEFEDLLRQYYYVGGMPEVVNEFATTKNYKSVRQKQLEILKSYEHDFSKHPPKEIVQRMQLLWSTVPSQLAKENKKFVYTAVRKSARARDFETAIQWLCSAGMTHKVTRISKGELPLKGFEDADSFKLYVLDIGLHGAMSGLNASTLTGGNAVFKQYKGAMTEQFVLQELQMFSDIQIFYWTPDVGTAEMDFVIELEGQVIPIEVKAETNLKAKSIAVFVKQNHPEKVIRMSMGNYSDGEVVVDLPLYAVSVLDKVACGGKA